MEEQLREEFASLMNMLSDGENYQTNIPTRGQGLNVKKGLERGNYLKTVNERRKVNKRSVKEQKKRVGREK